MRCHLLPSDTHVERHAGSALRTAVALTFFAILPGWALASESEREQLQLLVRQIDLMERTARHAAALPRTEGSRYRFDYPRLLDDITRVRGGIQDYLTPQRAQPRDSVEFDGDYTRESDGRSDTSCR